MNYKIKRFLPVIAAMFISACGTGGVTPGNCDNPTPLQIEACEAENNKGIEKTSNWDSLKWNDDTWG